MKIQKGDMVKMAHRGDYDVIIHGCNCFCTMGAGVAKQIKTIFPQAFEADQKTQTGDKKKLGSYSFARIDTGLHTLTIINAYTQFDYSGQGVLVEYDAVREVFSRIKNNFPNQRIAYPKIGAGLAKGDWKIISSIIDEEMAGEDHTLIEYQP